MPPPLGPAAALGTALLLLLLASEPAHAVLLRAREAAQFLRPRQRRAYQVFEEAKQGHLERECVEELCNKEEAREVFENDPETDYFYPRYLECVNKHGSPYSRSPDFAACVRVSSSSPACLETTSLSRRVSLQYLWSSLLWLISSRHHSPLMFRVMF